MLDPSLLIQPLTLKLRSGLRCSPAQPFVTYNFIQICGDIGLSEPERCVLPQRHSVYQRHLPSSPTTCATKSIYERSYMIRTVASLYDYLSTPPRLDLSFPSQVMTLCLSHSCAQWPPRPRKAMAGRSSLRSRPRPRPRRPQAPLRARVKTTPAWEEETRLRASPQRRRAPRTSGACPSSQRLATAAS